MQVRPDPGRGGGDPIKAVSSLYLLDAAVLAVIILGRNDVKTRHSLTRTTLLTAGASIAAIGLAVPATAATTTLDFAGNICGASGDQSCGNGSQIGQGYGDGTGVDVSYRSVTESTGATLEPFLKHWGANYGDLTNVVWGGTGPTGSFAEITFSALAGYELRLTGFDAGCYLNRTSCQSFPFSVSEIGGGTVASGTNVPPSGGHVSQSLGLGYSSTGYILRWGPDSYDGGLDNIAFDVRAIVTGGGGVPEPATWALLILGFGAIGGGMRRRGTTARALSNA